MKQPAFCSRSTTGLFFIAFLVILSSGDQVFAIEAHSQISGPFASTEDVNNTCIQCHDQVKKALLKDSHWSWQRLKTVNGESQTYGKRNGLSHFAIPAPLNKDTCMGCHITVNPSQFSFEQENISAVIDCLVCHDTSGTYKRTNPDGSEKENNFSYILRNIGRPSSKNCVSCHFANCSLPGDDQLNRINKHSNRPNQSDIHMLSKEINFSCLGCHVSGKEHSFSPEITEKGLLRTDSRCFSCHSNKPHAHQQLNAHSATVACQTCHIPQYAVNEPAIINWNWSLAGKISPISLHTAEGISNILDQNGYFLARNIDPVYMWDNGNDLIYTRGNRISTESATALQQPANKKDGSILAPFSVTYATQLYDTKYRYLISPLLSNDQTNIFQESDWNTVAQKGMDSIRLPYSGTYGFTTTVTYKRLNHGVAPAEKALDCLDCHGKHGRLQWEHLGYKQDPWIQEDHPVSAAETTPNHEEPIPQTNESTDHSIIIPPPTM
jgi:octaheme c-type cytochrome (tetrathionate reductase family)